MEQRNNDVYNHPQTEAEVNEQVNLQPAEAGDEQRRAVNPNQRANENLSNEDRSGDENIPDQIGSEITDGEDG